MGVFTILQETTKETMFMLKRIRQFGIPNENSVFIKISFTFWNLSHLKFLLVVLRTVLMLEVQVTQHLFKDVIRNWETFYSVHIKKQFFISNPGI